MDHKDLAGLFLKAFQPFQKAVFVRMAREGLKALDLRLDCHRLTKDLDLFSAIQDPSAGRPGGLVADKKDRAVRSPEIVL